MRWPVLAYASSIRAQPDEEVDVYVSCQDDRFELELVQLGTGRGLDLEAPVADIAPMTAAGRLQPLSLGSYAETEPVFPDLTRGDYCAWIWAYPTHIAGPEQCLLDWQARDGPGRWRLMLGDDGLIEFTERPSGAHVRCHRPLSEHCWHLIAASCDRSEGTVALDVFRADRWQGWHARSTVAITATGGLGAPGSVGMARGIREDGARIGAFDGKLEAPGIATRAARSGELAALRGGVPPQALFAQELAALWDFGWPHSSPILRDVGADAIHAACANRPMRVVTGSRWSHLASPPGERSPTYSAVHFHRDDVGSAQWDPDLRVKLPTSLRSGVYAWKLKAAHNPQHPFYVPLFVRPSGPQRNETAFLAPTNTYLAYANTLLGTTADNGAEIDQFLMSCPALGRSLYDLHKDGSGYCYASYRRPLIGFDPHYRQPATSAPRHFTADLHLLKLLSLRRHAVDVLTDYDLHEGGSDLLSPYRVIMTGSHPEYWTGVMLDALEGYLDGGGRLMYLGGNGFYWVTSFDQRDPSTIEVRRGFAGTRTWTSEPGEQYHSTTGELGGLWRLRGRPPERICGLGVSGYDHSARHGMGYRRVCSAGSEGDFALEGVGGDDFGSDAGEYGGAAGDEVDAVNLARGTPPDTIILARSSSLPGYAPMIEDEPTYDPGRMSDRNDAIRSEIVYWEGVSGARVFSVGSIAWCQALPEGAYRGPIAEITTNVLSHMLK